MIHPIQTIVTHPGGAHKDDFLACCVLLACYPEATVERRDPTPEELNDPSVAVVDIGHRHEPEKNNFDHHQFPADHDPVCSLSLVLQALELYEDARRFCDWMRTAEYLDSKGAVETAKWMSVAREVINRLSSPIDITALRAFAREPVLPSDSWVKEMMQCVGVDLLEYLRTLHSRMEWIAQQSEIWKVGPAGDPLKVLFLPRTDPLPEDPSLGLDRYIEGHPDAIVGLVYPDRRGSGYGLSRFQDHPSLDFCRLAEEPDVHFAHARGFLAKTTAVTPERLRELLNAARTQT